MTIKRLAMLLSLVTVSIVHAESVGGKITFTKQQL